MNTRTPPSPQPWPETVAFWAAANERRLLLKCCSTTGKAFFYPREHSPFDGSAATEWVEASGEGHIYSFSVISRNQPPYCIAYVSLREGPTILTNIVAQDLTTIRIGQPVRVTFVPSEDGQLVPMFEPA